MPRRYKAGVYVFLVLLIVFTVIIEAIEKEFNLPTEGELASSPAVIAAWRRCVVEKACGYDPAKMTLIWWSKLAWLASEWLMFASLFEGIGRGGSPSLVVRSACARRTSTTASTPSTARTCVRTGSCTRRRIVTDKIAAVVHPKCEKS